MPISRILSCWLAVCWILYLASSLDMWDFFVGYFGLCHVTRLESCFFSSPYLLFFFFLPRSRGFLFLCRVCHHVPEWFLIRNCGLLLFWSLVLSCYYGLFLRRFFFFLLPPVGCYLIRPLVVFCLLYIYIPKITAISGYGCGEMLDLLSFWRVGGIG